MAFKLSISDPVAALLPPECETLPARGISWNKATIVGRLIETSYWSQVYVYFEWGKTTSYGNTTTPVMYYEGDEGREFQAFLEGLQPETTYHYRAVVEATGYRSDEVGPGYGADMSFTTEEEQPIPAILYLWEPPYFDGYNWVDEPPDVPLGDKVGIRSKAENISDETRYVAIRTYITDPYGISMEHVTSSNLGPGQTLGSSVKKESDIPGIWTATIKLCLSPTYPYDVIQTIGPIPIADVQGVLPPLSGYLFSPRIYDATTGQNFYSDDFPAEIKGGHEVLAIVCWKNDGGESALFKTTLELVDPDGVVRASYVDQRELPPGEDNSCQTPYVVALDKAGTWKIHATLEAEGALLDEQTWDAIETTGVPPEFAGTITRKELEYDETRGDIPVTDIPIGVEQRGLIHIWGRNDLSTTQRMGIHWAVTDPDGLLVDEYDEWEMWPYTSPGEDHQFIGDRFDLDKEGTYTIKVELLMNPDDPVVVDSYDGVLCSTIPEMPPEYELIQHTIYHFAYIYDGDVEVSTITFKTDPFTPANWLGDIFANKLEEEVRAKGAHVLEVKVYVDTTPLLWKDFKIEVIGTPLGEAVEAGPGIAVGIPIWVGIVIAALAIIAVIIVSYYFIIKPLTYKHQPGLADVKVAWEKEALILDIQDAEEYWERTPTPLETLEGMSEEELRDHLDQIAEEEVPPEAISPWAIVAVVGGLGILGVGGAAALALAGRRE